MLHTKNIIEQKKEKLQCKKKLVTFYLDIEKQKHLKELSNAQNRTIKGTILCALELYFDSLGYEAWGK